MKPPKPSKHATAGAGRKQLRRNGPRKVLNRARGEEPPLEDRGIEFYPSLFSNIILDNPNLRLEVAPSNGEVGPAFVVLADVHGRPRVLIDITDASTHDLGREALTEGFKWRDCLVDAHGPWVEDGPNALVAAILKHGHGLRNPDIAKRINRTMGARLQEATRLRKSGRSLVAHFLLNYVRALLAVFEGYKEAQTDIQEALNRVEAGDEPFLPNAPITGEMVRRLLSSKRAIRVKQWRARAESPSKLSHSGRGLRKHF